MTRENKISLKIGSGGGITDVYEGWTAVNVTKSLETLSGAFQLQLTQLFNSDNVVQGFTVEDGSECILAVNDKPLISGFVDISDPSYSASSHIITASGRDKTCDIIDGTLIGNSDLSAPYTAKQLVKHILKVKSITSIDVIDLTTGINTLYEEDFDGGAGKNAWEQLDKYLRKKSIFATANVDGDIVLFRGSFGATNDALFNLTQGGNVNNILSGAKRGSRVDRFNKISVLSQSPSVISDGFFYEQGGDSYVAIDPTIRASRQLEIVADANLTSEECQDLANFHKNIRQARGTVYTYTVQSFTQSNGDLWLPNYEVYVQDEFFNIADSFLIKSVNFNQSLDTGSITTLELVDKLAYTLREPVAITEESNVLFEV